MPKVINDIVHDADVNRNKYTKSYTSFSSGGTSNHAVKPVSSESTRIQCLTKESERIYPILEIGDTVWAHSCTRNAWFRAVIFDLRPHTKTIGVRSKEFAQVDMHLRVISRGGDEFCDARQFYTGIFKIAKPTGLMDITFSGPEDLKILPNYEMFS